MKRAALRADSNGLVSDDDDEEEEESGGGEGGIVEGMYGFTPRAFRSGTDLRKL